MPKLSPRLRQRLGLAPPVAVSIQRGEAFRLEGCTRERIEYRGLEDDVIPAFLFTPTQGKSIGSVVVFHQHNGEFNFGKSEVAGEAGGSHITELRVARGHALDRERFEAMVQWIVGRVHMDQSPLEG